MEKKFANADEKIAAYVERTFCPEDDILREIRERSQMAGLPAIQVGRMDSLHLEVLTRVSGARKAVEIGTLGGYSGVSILRGLGEGGTLHTFEYEPLHAEVAAESFRRTGFSERVKIHIGPATENLSEIACEGPFDLVFIDADKVNYPNYIEWAARNLRVGGVMIGDNTLAWGMIADDTFSDPEDESSVKALRAFNSAAATSGRFRATMIPTGEGLTVAVKLR